MDNNIFIGDFTANNLINKINYILVRKKTGNRTGMTNSDSGNLSTI